MAYHKDCIHWQVCGRACPIEVSDCFYYVHLEPVIGGQWLHMESTNVYQCSNCNHIGEHDWYYCPYCGSCNIIGISENNL